MVKSGIVNGPDYDQTEIINFVPNAGWRDMQLEQKFSNLENQLYSLKAIEPYSTFCICERYKAVQKLEQTIVTQFVLSHSLVN